VFVRNTYAYLQHCLALRAQLKPDQERMQRILNLEPGELCRVQCGEQPVPEGLRQTVETR
jgi:hypothetical protein